MDWGAFPPAAKRPNAAYLDDAAQSKAAFEALGDTWVGQFQDDLHQAVLSVDPAGATHLSISGTRSPLSLDLFADVSLDPVVLLQSWCESEWLRPRTRGDVQRMLRAAVLVQAVREQLAAHARDASDGHDVGW